MRMPWKSPCAPPIRGWSVTVQDDGRGFQHGRAHGLGLIGMHERAESLGGSVKITSGPGKGTLIEVALPLPQRLASWADDYVA